MQEFVGKKVKVVFQDGDDSKAVFGIIQSFDGSFVYIIDDKGRMQNIGLKFIIRIKEVFNE